MEGGVCPKAIELMRLTIYNKSDFGLLHLYSAQRCFVLLDLVRIYLLNFYGHHDLNVRHLGCVWHI